MTNSQRVNVRSPNPLPKTTPLHYNIPMTQSERRTFLINRLLAERNEAAEIPEDEAAQKRLLRALFNVRPPLPAGAEFLCVQDEYLQEELRQRGVTDSADLKSVQPGIFLWQGDITTLKCDAVVNAANSQMLGCFVPNHACIDNAIHTFAGVQLRLECAEIMRKQGAEEPTGSAKITRAYNLPCRHVIHTVGPVVSGTLTGRDRRLLESCYTSCLECAAEHQLKTIAFCCISTGVFHFPNREAAEIAVQTVRTFRRQNQNAPDVIFNVFKDADYEIYRGLLG